VSARGPGINRNRRGGQYSIRSDETVRLIRPFGGRYACRPRL